MIAHRFRDNTVHVLDLTNSFFLRSKSLIWRKKLPTFLENQISIHLNSVELRLKIF